jgi:hypothetical protein
VSVDATRADGLRVTEAGNLAVARSGLITTFAPSVKDPAALARLIAQLVPGMDLTLAADGSLRVEWQGGVAKGGDSYVLRPSWLVENDQPTGTAAITTDGSGNLVYSDADGLRQTLRTALADPAALLALAIKLDANATLTGAEGHYVLTLGGQHYTLAPRVTLSAVPMSHAKDAWWAEGAELFIRNADGTAQGFAVK